MATAASPEENASACPPSRSPSASSNADQVGLPYRPYSTSPPATYVEAIVIGVFSGLSASCGGRPEVTATVAGRRVEASYGVGPELSGPGPVGCEDMAPH